MRIAHILYTSAKGLLTDLAGSWSPNKGTIMITITTKLHSGLTLSLAGKEFRMEFNTGPLNLLKAVREYNAERKEMIRSYGNIGAGHTWLEVDGVQIPWMYLPQTMEDSRLLIEDVRSGEFMRMLSDIDRDEERRYRDEISREFRP